MFLHNMNEQKTTFKEYLDIFKHFYGTFLEQNCNLVHKENLVYDYFEFLNDVKNMHDYCNIFNAS